MSSETQRPTQGPFAPIKRFLAIFLTAWAVVLAYLGLTRSGSAMIGFLVGAAVCLVVAVYCFRSFAFTRRKEF